MVHVVLCLGMLVQKVVTTAVEHQAGPINGTPLILSQALKWFNGDDECYINY